MSNSPLDNNSSDDQMNNLIGSLFNMRRFSPWYDDRADYNTDAKSYYDYLARSNKIIDAIVLLVNKLNNRDINLEETNSIKMEKLNNWNNGSLVTLLSNLKVSNNVNNAITLNEDGVYVNDLTEKLNHLDDRFSRLNEHIINVMAYGAKGDGVSDDTNAINNAIKDSTNNNLYTTNIYIPKGVYMIKSHDESMIDKDGYLKGTGGIKLVSNINLIMDKEAYLKVIPNNFRQYSLLTAYNIDNVNIYGGNLLGDRDVHYDKYGEWGYGVSISGSSNISISNVKISDMWGDGINLQVISEGENNNKFTNNKNIIINKVNSTRNRRQGMSVEGVENLLVKNSEFSNTFGTAPECGVDIEPWSNDNLCFNMTFENNVFSNNTNSGLLAMTGGVKKLIIDNNLFNNNNGKKYNNAQTTFYFNDKVSDIVVKNNNYINDGNMSIIARGGGKYTIKDNTLDSGILTDKGSTNIPIWGMYFSNNNISANKLINWDILNFKNTYDLFLNNNNINYTKSYNGHSLISIIDCEDVFINKNKLINSPRLMYINNTTNLTISNNYFDNGGIRTLEIHTSNEINLLSNYIYGSNHQNNTGEAILIDDQSHNIFISLNHLIKKIRKLDTVNLGTGVSGKLATINDTNNIINLNNMEVN